MTLRHFFSLILVSVVFAVPNPSDPPPTPPAEQVPAQTSSFWDYLFTPSAAAPSTAPSPSVPPPDGEPTLTDQALQYSGDLAKQTLEYSGTLAKEAVHDAAGIVVPPGTQVSANQDFLDQTASYINQAPGTSADPATIFGLYDVLSGLIEPTPDGGVSMKMPTSEMLEKIRPWTDPYFDTGPLITALKGYEAYVKVKDTVGNVKDKVGGAAGDVKDDVVNAANTVKDAGGEAVDKVKDFFGG